MAKFLALVHCDWIRSNRTVCGALGGTFFDEDVMSFETNSWTYAAAESSVHFTVLFANRTLVEFSGATRALFMQGVNEMEAADVA